MPGSKPVGFTSQAQFKACWAKHREAEARGETSSWNCHKLAHEGKSYKELPKKSTRCTGKTPRGRCNNRVRHKSGRCTHHPK